MHDWYQFEIDQAKQYENEGLLIPGRGFRYTAQHGKETARRRNSGQQATQRY